MASNKEVLIYHFRNALKSSIWAQSDKQGWDLDIWEKSIKKTIYIEAKAAHQLQSLIKEIDSYWSRWY